MFVYELEVRFIGEPDYYYFETEKDAIKARDELNNLPCERAYFGDVKTTATIHKIELKKNQYLSGNNIITSYKKGA